MFNIKSQKAGNDIVNIGSDINIKNQKILQNRKDILIEGEIHTNGKVLWINSEDKCEVRINNLNKLKGMESIKCRICKDGGFIDITIEK